MKSINLLHTGPLGVNTYIVSLGGPYVFIIDSAACKFCDDETVVTDYLSSNNLVPVAIVQTHGHFDHVAGLTALHSAYPDIPILIHKDDSAMIGKDSARIQSYCLGEMGFDAFVPAVSNLPEANFFLEDGKTLFDSLQNQKVPDTLSDWLVIHTPGHTQGSVCLYNESQKILISGDTVFYHSWGRTDLFGGSETQIRKSILKLQKIINPNTLVYPGHDKVGFPFAENF